jgi:MoaA/NifB/PqqE/SkfB family radical SAM enzyme
MTVMERVILGSDSRGDLSALALRWAMALASAGHTVEFEDRRHGVRVPPFDELAAPRTWSSSARPRVVAGSFDLASPAVGLDPWELPHAPPVVADPGSISLAGWQGCEHLTLLGLLGGAGLPAMRDWPAVAPSVVAAVCDAIAAWPAPLALELIEPALGCDEAQTTLLLAVLECSGLSFSLTCGPQGLTAAWLAQLASLRGLTRLEVVLPALSSTELQRWSRSPALSMLLAALASWSEGAAPLQLTIEVGHPSETSRELREGLLQMRGLAASGRLARCVVRPFAPYAGSPAMRDPQSWGARYRVGEGPHGWVARWSNESWRRKIAKELQLAAAAIGLPCAAPRLGHDHHQHAATIVRRLTDPFFDAAEELQRDRELAGVLQGEHAFCGPGTLEIDLTNDCNNTCAGCWCHSPLMGELRLSGPTKRRYLETELILRLLDDAAALGTRRVQLAGSGEPFMHPDVMAILAHAKRLGLHVTVVTNVNFITRDRADRLIEIGLDQLTASVWAGTPAMYVATHPNQTERSFERIRDVLSYLASRKDKLGLELPLVKMYHVVSRINCRELLPMVEFAVATGCERVELQVTDVVPGRSDVLALGDDDRAAILVQLRELARRTVDPTRTATREQALAAAFDSGAEIAQFGKFEQPSWPGWTWGDPLLETIYCPRGQEGSLPTDGFCDETETRYHYFWHVWDCHRCPEFTSCPIDKRTLSITKRFTELVGFGGFYRRVASMRAQAGEVRYEEAIVDRVPCTIGWTYSRVRVSGEVIPCCKGHLHPLGSLHEQTFSQIWFGAAHDELRRMGKHHAKSHPYFARIGCYRSCDNVGNNLETEARLAGLDPARRAALQSCTGLPPFVPAPDPHVLLHGHEAVE